MFELKHKDNLNNKVETWWYRNKEIMSKKLLNERDYDELFYKRKEDKQSWRQDVNFLIDDRDVDFKWLPYEYNMSVRE